MTSVSTLRVSPTKYILAKNSSGRPCPVENCIQADPNVNTGDIVHDPDHQQANVAITPAKQQ